jgi:hypothetical protein
MRISPLVFVIPLLVAAGLSGCSAKTDPSDADPGTAPAVETQDTASRIFFRCETAVVVPDGTQWSYRTGLFNNTSGRVEVTVSARRNGQLTTYPAMSLRKIGTDTFSDDARITLRLTHRANGAKSIRVDHHSIGRMASPENGFCTQEVLAQEDHQRHSFFWGARDGLNRMWKVYALGDRVLEGWNQLPGVEFRLNTPTPSDPYEKAIGWMGYVRSCDPRPSVTHPIPGPDGAIFFLLDVLDQAASLGTSAACVGQRGRMHSYNQIEVYITRDHRSRLTPRRFLEACGEGNETAWVNHYTYNGPDRYLSSVACIHQFNPTASGRQPYLRMKVFNYENSRESDWATLVPG